MIASCPDIRGVRHRWTPIAIGYAARRLVQQPGILHYQFANHLHIAAPDRVSHAARGNQPRPVWESVHSGERELGIG